MKDMKEFLKDRQDMWDIFVKRNEYHLDRPATYSKNDSELKNFNVNIPEISKFLVENGLKVEYPENKQFAVCLTHDVDEIYPPFIHTLISSLYHFKNFDVDELINSLFWKYKGKEFSPYWNFNEIIKLEKKYDAQSSFYFIATDIDVKKFRYDIEDLENMLCKIVDNGCEVGLHGGSFSFIDLKEILKEKRRLENVLGKKVIGYRNHYLRFKTPTTWEILVKAGFKYDTTFGYNDMIGFRNGLCHPFRPFNLNIDRNIDILEIPLIIMDGALFWTSISLESAWNKTKNIIDTVEKYNGILTLLWHSDVFGSPHRKKWSKLYEKILGYCYENNAWMTNGENIWRWWANNMEI